MKKKAKKHAGKQAKKAVHPLTPHQLMLPMLVGMAATKQNLEAWVHQQGLAVLQEMFGADAEEMVGPKGKHQKNRRFNNWGSTDAEFTLGGRKIIVPRPIPRRV